MTRVNMTTLAGMANGWKGGKLQRNQDYNKLETKTATDTDFSNRGYPPLASRHADARESLPYFSEGGQYVPAGHWVTLHYALTPTPLELSGSDAPSCNQMRPRNFMHEFPFETQPFLDAGINFGVTVPHYLLLAQTCCRSQ